MPHNNKPTIKFQVGRTSIRPNSCGNLTISGSDELNELTCERDIEHREDVRSSHD